MKISPRPFHTDHIDLPAVAGATLFASFVMRDSKRP